MAGNDGTYHHLLKSQQDWHSLFQLTSFAFLHYSSVIFYNTTTASTFYLFQKFLSVSTDPVLTETTQ